MADPAYFEVTPPLSWQCFGLGLRTPETSQGRLACKDLPRVRLPPSLWPQGHGNNQMKLTKILRRRLSITVLVMGLTLLAAACGSEPAPTVAPTSVPTVAPTPTPTPELTLDSVLSSAGQGLAEMSTAKFQMIDELESGSQFFGMTLKNVEGEIKSPDSFRMLVNVETPNFGFVAIEMMAVGEQAYMKFSRDAPWAPLPLEQVPFNFGGYGRYFERIAAHPQGCIFYWPGSL